MVSSSFESKCYRPSGVVPVFGAAATLFFSVAAGVLLGAVYAFVNHHDPVLYLNVLLAAGLGWALGWLVSKGVRKFRIRSRTAAAVIGLTAFTAAYAAHWPAYVATVLVDFEEEVSSYDVGLVTELSVELAMDPAESWDLIQEINEAGVWSISGSSGSSGSSETPVRGVFLSLIWAAEALVICWFAVTRPWKAAGIPYSERQDKWLEPAELPGRIAFVDNKEEFIGALSRGDCSALSALPPSDDGQRGYATVVLYADAFEPYVSVTNVSQPGGEKQKPGGGWGKKGKKILRWLAGGSSKTETSQSVVQYLKISPTAAQNISSGLGFGA